MSGFDCQFIEEPPQYLQCNCPICLLILREPYQVTCCGKSFCRDCIQRIRTKKWPCPTCKAKSFDAFQNKGFQQPLYGFKVFCSNKDEGCGWQGELGQLDQHLNANAGNEKKYFGCSYTNIKCIFCLRSYWRSELEDHMSLECIQRPFTCSMCHEYSSIYKDVVINHQPECKCRHVECPNSCGASNLQCQHLEEHVLSQCPLTLVECEFSDAGCDAKVCRRDLPSHLKNNVVNHLVLLMKENKKLKIQLHEQELSIHQHQETVTLKLKQHLGRAREAASFKEQLDEVKEATICNAALIYEIQTDTRMSNLKNLTKESKLRGDILKLQTEGQQQLTSLKEVKKKLDIIEGEKTQLKKQLNELQREQQGRLSNDIQLLQLKTQVSMFHQQLRSQELQLKQRFDKIEEKEGTVKKKLSEIQRESLDLKEQQKKTGEELQKKLCQQQATSLKEGHFEKKLDKIEEGEKQLKKDLDKVHGETLDVKAQQINATADFKLKLDNQNKEHQDQMAALNREISHLKERLRSQEDCLEAEKKFTQNFNRIAPLEISSPLSQQRRIYKLEPFYSHAGGYKLQFEAVLQNSTLLRTRYTILDSEFVVKLPCTLEITTMLCNQEDDKDHIMLNHTTRSSNVNPAWVSTNMTDTSRYSKNYFYLFEVLEVNIVFEQQ